MLMQPAPPTVYEQWVPFLPFLGVILGGIIATIGAMGVAHLSNRAQKSIGKGKSGFNFCGSEEKSSKIYTGR